MSSNKIEMVSIESLYQEIRAILDHARTAAYRSVNFSMIYAYWQVGHRIVTHEQGGKSYADYGKNVLGKLSKKLTAEFGKGYTPTNLRYMRQFYIAFPIHHALSDKSKRETIRRLASFSAQQKMRPLLNTQYSTRISKFLPQNTNSIYQQKKN